MDSAAGLSVSNSEIVTSEPHSEFVNSLSTEQSYFHARWKKNARFLYDLLATHVLPWPSLTVQWFPDIERLPQKNCLRQRLLYGTHTPPDVKNHVDLANFELTDISSMTLDPSKHYDEDAGELGGYRTEQVCRFHPTQQMRHQGDVNRARYMPQNPDIIATMSSGGETFVFDRTKHTLVPGSECSPNIHFLNGHTEEGYGLAWNRLREGLLLTAANDGKVCEWDMENYTRSSHSVSPVRVFSKHKAAVNDVEYHPQHVNVYATASDDGDCSICDTRTESQTVGKITFTDSVRDGLPYAVAHHPVQATVIAIGTERCISLYDYRDTSRPLRVVCMDAASLGPVDSLPSQITYPLGATSLAWSAFDSNRLYSACQSICSVWNFSLEEQPLQFVHAGHKAEVSDLSVSLHEPDLVASVSQDNELHIWKPSTNILHPQK
ncbi:CAF assembly factor complex subunit C [Schizosaccharomyces japonicus yFS275]|uniref:CAF assembly factor complex subunit C n=1 Tax=Schizosaccharomyces japonicus (strain yFS275 / FY16936) TaxID=402676 RepID=B6K2H0_SCHJY|nr:CAF assembly factor complex subunit C [Schizosaccharomyces japonicus yFS275]EEB07351.1 CAF assembly factor complex subunit C [Schizosaccharomyces japonicus yFS275]